MTIIHFVQKMKSSGWGPSGGWVPEELLNINQEYDAEFSDKNGKLMFVKRETILALELKYFAQWIKKTERLVYKSFIAQIF